MFPLRDKWSRNRYVMLTKPCNTYTFVFSKSYVLYRAQQNWTFGIKQEVYDYQFKLILVDGVRIWRACYQAAYVHSYFKSDNKHVFCGMVKLVYVTSDIIHLLVKVRKGGWTVILVKTQTQQSIFTFDYLTTWVKEDIKWYY